MPAEGPGAPGLPERIDAVYFDAGGVLLDLDHAYVRRLIKAANIETDDAFLARSEALARHAIDRAVRGGAQVSDTWRDCFHLMLGHVGVPSELQDGMIDSLWEAHKRVGLWTVPVEGAPETVAELRRRGYRTAVISNAEGQIERDLNKTAFDGLFETVVDSHVVGIEKPQPGIFEIALERMGQDSDYVVYVGDLPTVDVEGARSAGLSPILIDRFDLYPDVEAPRIESITQLTELLPQK